MWRNDFFSRGMCVLQKKVFANLLILFFCAALIVAQNSSQKNLIESAASSGTTLYWDTLSQGGILEKNGRQISFRAGSPVILLNNEKFLKVDSPQISEGTIFVTNDFLREIESFFSAQNSSEENFRVGAILIDPGHGGKDSGASMTHKINGKNVTLKEKDINLIVSKMLAERLKSAYPEKQIIMTRSADVFLSLQERTDIANSTNSKLKEREAVLYVSIHVNSSLDKKARGYEVWYLSPGYRRTVLDSGKKVEDPKLFNILNSMMEEEYTTESILIAKFIMDGLGAQIGSLSVPRGIKAEEWFVVRNSNMPSVLVEVGFVSNAEEAKLLNDNAYLQKTAFGIYNGVSAFVAHFERSRGFSR